MMLALALMLQSINMIQTVSGTTTGASVQALPASSERSYLVCQSATTNTAPVLVDFGRAADAAGSIELLPGGSVTFNQRAAPSGAVNIGGAAGSAWRCKSGSN